MKSVAWLVVAGTFLCLLNNMGLAHDTSINSEAARHDHSLLPIWDKPAFAPAPDIGQVPRLDRPAKGDRVDFLLRPELQRTGPLLAQQGNWPANSEHAP
jgi:hypothetical protein